MSALKFNTILTAALALALASFGCDGPPGQPTEADRYQRPTDILDFETLYGTNCSGCHGAEGHLGPVRPLNDPLFLAIAGAANLRKAATYGLAGTAMPAFGVEAGGVLTPPQINAIVSGMLERWGDPSLDPSSLPAFSEADALAAGELAGRAGPGREVFLQFCAECHGANGRGSETAGAVVDGSYLALTSNQGLRNTVIAGRTDLGMPDYRGHGDPVHPRVIPPQAISDVVAWLVAQRVRYPGQTYPEGTATPPLPAVTEKTP